MTVTRTNLATHLPLRTPFAVHIFPIYACNFKCTYCLHALDSMTLARKGFKRQAMEFSVFKKAVADITEFPDKLRALIFAGHGEPLLHKDICAMVAYAKRNEIAERVEIVTNASLLDRAMADGLIEAGVDRLKISIQGTSEAKYERVARVKLDYEQFLANLAYFHARKRHTEVYIKIIDIALDGEADELRFRELFSPVADEVNIEYAIPFIKELDHSLYDKTFDTCKQGNSGGSEICSMPFYMQVVAPNGDVLPCCSSDVPRVLGNVRETSLQSIWTSKDHNLFLRQMLAGKNQNAVCAACSVPRYGLQQGDYLDDYKNDLLTQYGEKLG